MKELSIEEVVKAYDGLIKRLKDLKFAYRFSPLSDTIDEYFPELKESEDERIRKELIKHCKNQAKPYIDTGNECPQIQSWIAWLEKQGEQETIDKIQFDKKYKCIASPRYSVFMKGEIYVPKDKFLCSLMNLCFDCFEPIEDDEKKPTDKVEPKFKVEEGKWYVCISQFCNCIEGRVYKATSDNRIMDDFGTEYDIHNDAYKYFRLWTIQDAKSGDVLTSSGCLLIFEKLLPKDCGVSYCHYDFVSPTPQFDFTKDYNWYFGKEAEVYPATKEQRNLLFQKMKEAGYEWDVEKKELKKIEQKSTNKLEPKFKFGDRVKNKKSGVTQILGSCIEDVYEGAFPFRIKDQEDWELVDENPAWIEEDEKIVNGIITILKPLHETECDYDKYKNSLITWLKSLKDRVQPQPKQEWSEEDERVIDDAVYYLENYNSSEIIQGEFNKQYVLAVINKLKSLKPQNTWKPSEEQLEALWSATEKYLESDNKNVRKLRGEVLESLYNDLKKLKG